MWERGMAIDRVIDVVSEDKATTSVTTLKNEARGQVKNFLDFQ